MQGSEFNANTLHLNAGVPKMSPNGSSPTPSTNALLHQQQIQFPSPSTTWQLDSMPWNLATNMAQPGGVMQFSAHTANRKSQLHQKRKSELTVDLPLKQFISEEKITAHFNGLHISSDYIQNTPSSPTSLSGAGGLGDDDDIPSTSSGKCFTNLTYQDYEVTAKELSEKLKKASRITMCEEIRKLNEEQRKVSFLPEALLNRIERPCTALVLWQPPPILELLKERGQKETEHDSHALLQQPSNHEMIDEDFVDSTDSQDIDDFYIDNNNTCSLDFNDLKPDGMDEDL